MSSTVLLLFKQNTSNQLKGGKKVYSGYQLIEFACHEHENVALNYLQGNLAQDC